MSKKSDKNYIKALGFGKISGVIFLAIGVIALIITLPYFTAEKYVDDGSTALPRPFGEEPLLITSAGQSTDIYIIKDLANKLMIDNYFIPMASEEQLKEVKSVVIVVGYSNVGISLNDLDTQEEIQRVEAMLEGVKENNISLVTIYLRGSQMLDTNNKQLLELAGSYSDYLLIVEENDKDTYYKELANEFNIPVTIVNDVNEISEAFVSVFR